MTFKTYLQILLFSCIAALTACGGGGDDDDNPSTGNPTPQPTAEPTPTTQTGVFLDSAVANIAYTTETQTGVTNAAGECQYQSGETVTFAIGGLALPSVAAGPVITPLDLAGTEDPENNVVVNISRLLQTLDTDGDPDNGITISEAALSINTQVDFNVPVADFESNSDVLDVIVAGGQDTVPSGLVSAEDAVAHLQGTLEAIEASASIVGAWRLTGRPQGAVGGSDAAIVVLLGSGVYYFIEVNEINDGDDWEYGTYTYADGSLVFDTTLDLNGNIGPSDAELDITLEANSFSFAGDPEEGESGDYSFTRIGLTGDSIEGVWTLTDEPESEILFMFAADGTYVAVQPYEVENEVGFEWGTYSLAEGMVTVSIMKDIGASLLGDESNSASFTASVQGDLMTADFDGETYTLERL